MFFDVANSDVGENKYANTGHAIAKVYLNGPQYDTDTPVNIINNISTNLSTTMYNDINVNIYVANVFLLALIFFKNLSIIFIIFPFIFYHTHILSYKTPKITSFLHMIGQEPIGTMTHLREEALYQWCHKLLNSREEYQASYDRIESLRVDSQRNAEIAISLLKDY